ncbi:MAG: hypothetical protein GEU97_18905 [Actinophytocola sp.]|nr:hypothetical protein [Actinophytocola sp.]
MTCEECREQLSARLDGEETPCLRADVDAHLAACDACREWQDAAARVTRLARMAVARPGPDLVDAVLAARPARRCGTSRSASGSCGSRSGSPTLRGSCRRLGAFVLALTVRRRQPRPGPESRITADGIQPAPRRHAA